MKNEFRDFVVLQLGSLPGLTCRPMFGGHGLWQSGTFFGMIYQDRLCFRVDDDTRPTYVEAGMEPFKAGEFVATNYYMVPDDVLASGTKLNEWAERAIATALKAKPKKKRKG